MYLLHALLTVRHEWDSTKSNGKGEYYLNMQNTTSDLVN